MKIIKSTRKLPSIAASTRAAKRNKILGGYMPPNPYDVGPPDPKDKELSKYTTDLYIYFDEPVTVDANGDYELTGTEYGFDPAPDSNGYYYDEETGATLTNADNIYDELYTLLDINESLAGVAPGNYRINGYIILEYLVSGVTYIDEYQGRDEDGDPIVDMEYFTDNADVKLVSSEMEDFQITPDSNDVVTSSTKVVAGSAMPQGLDLYISGERNYDGSHYFVVEDRNGAEFDQGDVAAIEDVTGYYAEQHYSDVIWVEAPEGDKQRLANLLSNNAVLGATDTDGADTNGGDVFDEIQEIGQEFTSENTSINATKLPAVFKMVSFQPNTVNLDYGGGKFDNVADYLTQYDVINLVYDPFNRTAEHNKEVIQLLREHGGADTATLSNVLNVIKEPEVRLNVLNNIKKLLKSGGELYITVYEGKGDGAEGPTKSGYQLNRKTADYLEEIQQVFPDAKRKGKLITATNTGSITSATECSLDSEYQRIDRNGSDYEYEIAALSYMYGLSLKDAEQQYDTFTDEEIQNAVQYYNLKDLPQSERLKQYNSITTATDINDFNADECCEEEITGDDNNSLICM